MLYNIQESCTVLFTVFTNCFIPHNCQKLAKKTPKYPNLAIFGIFLGFFGHIKFRHGSKNFSHFVQCIGTIYSSFYCFYKAFYPPSLPKTGKKTPKYPNLTIFGHFLGDFLAILSSDMGLKTFHMLHNVQESCTVLLTVFTKHFIHHNCQKLAKNPKYPNLAIFGNFCGFFGHIKFIHGSKKNSHVVQYIGTMYNSY